MKDTETKKKGQCLAEDQDLVERLRSVGPGPHIGDRQRHEVDSIQIEAILRSRKSMAHFDKSTKKYSILLGAFALIQIVIALMQFTLTVVGTENKLLSSLLFAALVGMVIFMMNKLDKILENK